MGTLTDLIYRFWGAILSWINGIMWLGVAIGIFMVIQGIYNLALGRYGDASEKSGIYLLIFGASLTSLIALMATGSETAFGTDQAETIFKSLKH